MLVMEQKKRKQAAVNVPHDLVEKLDELAKYLFASNQATVVSFSGTVVRLLREADDKGMLDPDYWGRRSKR